MTKFFYFFLVLFFLSSYTFSQESIFDASRNGNIDTVQKLYKINPNSINSEDENGYSPLVLACYHGHEKIVEFLADKVKSINPETSYGSPLMAATVKGYVNIVSILLSNNADPNLADNKGTTAAHYAVLFRNYEIIERLVEAKADFNIKNDSGKTALDYANAHKDDRINKLLQL